MPETREVGLTALKSIYRQYMRKDFPLQELRPWQAMKKAWDRGVYSAFGYYENETLLAYASFYDCSMHPYSLLDYLAVMPRLRGQGIGSAFLKELLPLGSVNKDIFIEAESPALAREEKEKHTREKRVAFYEKNGARTTGINCRLFGVDYTLLYYPKQGEIQTKKVSLQQIRDLYADLYGSLFKRMCRIYRP